MVCSLTREGWGRSIRGGGVSGRNVTLWVGDVIGNEEVKTGHWWQKKTGGGGWGGVGVLKGNGNGNGNGNDNGNGNVMVTLFLHGKSSSKYYKMIQDQLIIPS